ncbi:endonuclease NucS [Thermococcus zilligii]|uniref:endonuclease NucS n=1 Tax=Thermococcus zilligii TaxID=54076 RepID=UPI000496A747|nr:endonuclease NucS [Thermococcus zilligii]
MSKVEFRVNPSPEEIKLLVDSAISSEALLTIFAHCRVYYDGRAKSELGSGDRVIIVKPDGSFLIHQSKKREPVNWQPPGSVVHVELREKPVLVSVRRKPPETLEVELEEVYLITVFHAEDYEELALTGSEAEMAELIFEQPEVIEPGFKPLYREKPVKHGIVDVLGVDREGNIVVLELKRRRADLHAVSQLKRYVETLKEEHGNVRGILVAPSLTSGARKLLEKEGLEFRKLQPPKGGKKSRGKQLRLF